MTIRTCRDFTVFRALPCIPCPEIQLSFERIERRTNDPAT